MARTLDPPHPTIREIRRLHVDAILRADHSIFIENQYFGSRALFNALRHRMARTDLPRLDLAMIYPRELHSITEQLSVGSQQSAMFKRLKELAAEGGHRIGIYFSESADPGAAEPRARYIHSKIMIVDEWFLTVGSANTNNRSMGFDSELHVSWETSPEGTSELSRQIRRARLNLLVEHVGLPPRETLRALRETTGWVDVLNRWATQGKGALRHHPMTSRMDENLIVQTLSAEGPIMDPDHAVLEEDIFEEIAPSHRERVAAGFRHLRRVFGRRGRPQWILSVNSPADLARMPHKVWAFALRMARRLLVPFFILLVFVIVVWSIWHLLDIFQ